MEHRGEHVPSGENERSKAVQRRCPAQTPLPDYMVRARRLPSAIASIMGFPPSDSLWDGN